MAQERADTFIWQSAHGLESRAGLDLQRKHTDAALAAYRAAVKAAAGVQTEVARSGEAALIGKLDQLRRIRAAVDVGTLKPLTAFQAYNSIVDATLPLGHGSLADPNMSIPLYEQGIARRSEHVSPALRARRGRRRPGEAHEFIGRKAALVGGALVSGGRMSPAEHQLFVRAVSDQRLLEQIGTSPAYWQQSPDPYTQILASNAYAAFKAMEERISRLESAIRAISMRNA